MVILLSLRVISITAQNSVICFCIPVVLCTQMEMKNYLVSSTTIYCSRRSSLWKIPDILTTEIQPTPLLESDLYFICFNLTLFYLTQPRPILCINVSYVSFKNYLFNLFHNVQPVTYISYVLTSNLQKTRSRTRNTNNISAHCSCIT